MSRRFSFSDFGLALFLAAGAQLAILVAGAFIYKPIDRFFDPPSPGSLRVHRSGNVVLEQRTGGFRDLSGRPLDDAQASRLLPRGAVKQPWLSFASLLSESAQRDRQRRRDWLYRMVELAGDAPVSWYGVRPSAQSDLAYCVGYDKVTKDIFGYLGQKGFHRELPPREEWFPTNGDLRMWVSIASIGNTADGARANTYKRSLPGGVVFLASPDRIWEIFVVSRVARVLFEAPNIIDICASPDERSGLFVRTDSKVIAIDLEGRPRATWKIPQELQREDLQWYELTDGNALVQTLHQPGSDIHLRFFWVHHDGTISKTERVDARLGLPCGPGVEHLIWAAASPAPPTSSFISLVAVPLNAVGQGEQPDLPTAMARTLSDAWPALLAVYVLSAVLAWLTYRRQVRYALPAAGLWAVFVFLLGVPGWLAYRWHRDWPLLKECGECHRAAPRDREACAACGQLFAAPPLLGTEIFG